MTGFGTAEGSVGARRVRVEVRTVNHRHHHATVRGPADLAGIEHEIRELLRRRLDRGHVTVVVSWQEDGVGAGPQVDWDRAAAAAAALRELQARLGLGGEVTVEQVTRFPDVLVPESRAVPLEWAQLEPVVEEAVAACLAMRRREGEVLTAEVLGRLDTIEAHAARVEALLPARVEREAARLRLAIAELVQGVEVDPARIAQEVAFLADRLDVTEELVRLRAHLAAGREALAAERPVGKQLGFLAQEIGREVNTVGSKANDAAIAHEVIAMKGELEKVREQLENLE